MEINLVDIIGALGGTAGIIAIINAVMQPFNSKLRDVIKAELEPVTDKLKENDEATLALLRHSITKYYYSYKDTRTLSLYQQ